MVSELIICNCKKHTYLGYQHNIHFWSSLRKNVKYRCMSLLCIHIYIYMYWCTCVYITYTFPSSVRGESLETWHHTSNEHSYCSHLISEVAFSTTRNQSSLENWLISRRGLGKYMMTFEFHAVEKRRKWSKNGGNVSKRQRSQIEVCTNGQIRNSLNISINNGKEIIIHWKNNPWYWNKKNKCERRRNSSLQWKMN